MAEALGNLDALIERTVRAVAFNLLLGGNARRALFASPGGINGKRRHRRGRERQSQRNGRNCTRSDNLHLMRKGINDRRVIAHAVPFPREGPVIRLPAHALRSVKAKRARKRTGDGGAFTHRRHCANRRRRPSEHTSVPCSPCSCAKRAAAAKRSNRSSVKRYQVELYSPGRPRSNARPKPELGLRPIGSRHTTAQESPGQTYNP